MAAIILLVVIFFSRLFFPPQIFVNLDYGRSDLIHFNIPVKIALANSLESFALPFWEPKIGQGFPLFGEGQIGALYFPNLILFGLLPIWLAFAASYIITFTLASLGTYLLLRSASLGKKSSLLAAITFGFSPIFVLQIHHFNLIQTASLVPWIFYLINAFLTTKRVIYISFLPIVISQQIFTGFPQLTFYSLFGLIFFLIFKISTQSRTFWGRLKVTLVILIFIALGFLIGSVQLTATYTIAREARRIETSNSKSLLSEFPLQYKNLLTLINPFILGNPKEGTFPPWQPGKWSIFWESSLYFGIVQLILTVFYMIFLIVKKDRDKNQVFFWFFLATLGLTLSLGNLAPLHPLFSIPPFSIFRVPSRFLIIFFLAASIIAGYGANHLEKTKNRKISSFIVVIIILLAILDIFRLWYTYNPTGEQKRWLATPEILEGIPKNARIWSQGQSKVWNEIFLDNGWKTEKELENFLFFKNFVGQNSNMTYGYTSTLAYGGVTPRRVQITERLASLAIEEQGNNLVIGSASQKVLDFTSTNYLITDKSIDSANWQRGKTLEKEQTKITIYENKNPLPQAYITNDYKIAKTVGDISQILASEDFDPAKSVILEKEINLEKSNQGEGKVKIRNYQKTKVTLEAELSTPSLVVLADSFYPNWKAYVDGEQKEILAANINSRALIVKGGKHTIEFIYQPKKIWALVSIISLGTAIVLIIKTKKLRVK